MAKLADTMFGYSCCHNSSYLASDVKEDEVLLWPYTKLWHMMSLVHKKEGGKERPPFFFFSGQPYCDSKRRCLSKDMKTMDWQAMKTTEGNTEEAQGSYKKCPSSSGKVNWSMPDTRRAKGSCKANWSFVPQKEQLISTAPLWEAPGADYSLKASCVPKGLSQVGCSWKSGKETHTFLVSPFTLQREVFYLWLKYSHLFFVVLVDFFLHKEAGETALPHRWFPIKIINNNVGTLFLERRFVSVPKWANRGKISCYALRKK